MPTCMACGCFFVVVGCLSCFPTNPILFHFFLFQVCLSPSRLGPGSPTTKRSTLRAPSSCLASSRARRASAAGSETVSQSASTRRSTSGPRRPKLETARLRSQMPAWSTTTVSGSAKSPRARSTPRMPSSLKEQTL